MLYLARNGRPDILWSVNKLARFITLWTKFLQINRILNHLFGHWAEIGWVACHKHHKSHKKIDVMEDIDSVPSNVQSARQEALLFVFEDNEAVIKMIIKEEVLQ